MELLTLVAVGIAMGLGLILVSGQRARGAARDWLAHTGSGRRAAAVDQRVLVEGIATWTENLRDAVTASAGLEQAFVTVERHCPEVLQRATSRLVAQLRYRALDDALRDFADDVDHPTCDFVVAALVTGARHQTRDVASLLTQLAESARSECSLYLRIWVSRARSRTAVRIIAIAVLSFIVGLFVFNRAYLAPFWSTTGVFVLLLASALFVASFLWLDKTARVPTPARFLMQRAGDVQGTLQ